MKNLFFLINYCLYKIESFISCYLLFFLLLSSKNQKLSS
nr:MAG TPA: hypothetical protein [Caudoviricetes sp.]